MYYRPAKLNCCCNLFAGNVTIVGSLIFNSAYLAPFFGGSSAAIRNISTALGQSNLTDSDKKKAVAAACTLGLEQREPQAVALLAAAAVSANNSYVSAINDGFTNVSLSCCMRIGSMHDTRRLSLS